MRFDLPRATRFGMETSLKIKATTVYTSRPLPKRDIVVSNGAGKSKRIPVLYNTYEFPITVRQGRRRAGIEYFLPKLLRTPIMVACLPALPNPQIKPIGGIWRASVCVPNDI